MTDIEKIISALADGAVPSHGQWLKLICEADARERSYAAELARQRTVERFGKIIYFRGIIEFTNICRNDCLYCGIRKSNGNAERYRLTDDEISECCREGYDFGYRSFVLQGGEDPHFDDERLLPLIRRIREEFPDCAITLSLGERSRESYKALREAGADRYLLRHETASGAHYRKLHPPYQLLENRMRCLHDLKDLGYQAGAGMMVGSPFQTPEYLAADFEFLHEFQPEMVGMGPFIPHKDTPFKDCAAGSAEDTLYYLSLVRLLLPDALIPATTALGTLESDGRQKGVLCGCNVVMPNLSPASVRKKYMLYDNKAGIGDDAESSINKLRRQMEEIGYEVVVGRGDFEKRSRK